MSSSRKAVVVTGVSRGIGLALCLQLLKQDHYEVIGISRTAKDNLNKDLLKYEKFQYIQADLTATKGIDTVLNTLKQYDENSAQFEIYALVNNAAVLITPKNLEDENFADLQMAIDLNLTVPVKLCVGIIPYMRQDSRILNLTSRAGVTVVPQIGTYCIAKAGLDMATKILRAELAEKRIAVATIIPGEVDTGMQTTLRCEDQDQSSFKLKAAFQENKNSDALISPALCAQFLHWVLCRVDHATFNTQEGAWYIYDESHHQHWLTDGQVLPKCPF